MIRLLFSFTFLIFGFLYSRAQVIGEDYIAIPIDNRERFLLKFLSDSTLEVSTIPRHMMPLIKSKIFSFRSADSTITVVPKKIVTQDTLGLTEGILSIF